MENRKKIKYECLNVGKSKNVGYEVLYDIGCLHYLKIREDGTENYFNQFSEPCDFFYKSGQIQENLYPIISSRYNSFKFAYIHEKSSNDTEKAYLMKPLLSFGEMVDPLVLKTKIHLVKNL